MFLRFRNCKETLNVCKYSFISLASVTRFIWVWVPDLEKGQEKERERNIKL